MSESSFMCDLLRSTFAADAIAVAVQMRTIAGLSTTNWPAEVIPYSTAVRIGFRRRGGGCGFGGRSGCGFRSGGRCRSRRWSRGRGRFGRRGGRWCWCWRWCWSGVARDQLWCWVRDDALLHRPAGRPCARGEDSKGADDSTDNGPGLGFGGGRSGGGSDGGTWRNRRADSD